MRQSSVIKREPRGERKSEFVGVFLSPDELARLKAAATKAGHGNAGWFIREAVRQAVAAQGI